jgi:hypothetical protein
MLVSALDALERQNLINSQDWRQQRMTSQRYLQAHEARDLERDILIAQLYRLESKLDKDGQTRLLKLLGPARILELLKQPEKLLQVEDAYARGNVSLALASGKLTVSQNIADVLSPMLGLRNLSFLERTSKEVKEHTAGHPREWWKCVLAPEELQESKCRAIRADVASQLAATLTSLWQPVKKFDISMSIDLGNDTYLNWQSGTAASFMATIQENKTRAERVTIHINAKCMPLLSPSDALFDDVMFAAETLSGRKLDALARSSALVLVMLAWLRLTLPSKILMVEVNKPDDAPRRDLPASIDLDTPKFAQTETASNKFMVSRNGLYFTLWPSRAGSYR